jgi:hypothetical protein
MVITGVWFAARRFLRQHDAGTLPVTEFFGLFAGESSL